MKISLLSAITLLACLFTVFESKGQQPVSFKITTAKGLAIPDDHGRMFLYFSKKNKEPRHSVEPDNIPKSGFVFAKDVSWRTAAALTIRDGLIGFPAKELSRLDTGLYYVQALYDVDTFYSTNDAAGNYYSEAIQVRLVKGKAIVANLEISKKIQADTVKEDKYVRHVRIQSKLLSDFWKRPMYVDAGVLLPADYDSSASVKYPVRYKVGGYGSHWTRISRFHQDPAFKKNWLDTTMPRMVMVYLDCEAPFGDSYQMNSANNGPYNDMLTQELIPYIEAKYNGMGTPETRFVDGGSTGGWVSLALQVFNPDFFNGCWSFYGDPVDFHYFQLVNLYKDSNAFVNRYGYDNPSMRTTHGEPMLSIRDEVGYEAVLGRGNNFTTSGSQWGGWNAVYSPRGADGRPKAIWNSFTGKIDTSVVRYWKEHWDLKVYLEKNWATLGPKLQGKIHIWMGDMDNYYLNEAMRLLQKYMEGTTSPKSDAEFHFGAMMGHGWEPLTEAEKMKQMLDRTRRPM